MPRGHRESCTVRNTFWDSDRWVAICEPRNPVEAMMASGPIVRGRKGETEAQLKARLERGRGT